MTNIKFRAWDKIYKKMLDSTMELGGRCDINSYGSDASLGDINDFFNNNEDFAFMQFTGLTDKNGEDIYESDILEEDDGRLYTVVWSEENCCFEAVKQNEDYKQCRDFKDLHYMKIITNIYEKH